MIALKFFGCDKVMICDFSDYRLGIAMELGFEVCNTGKSDFKTAALKYFGEAYSPFGTAVKADIYLDAAGAESILDMFIELGTIGSRFVSVAVNKAIRSVDLLHMTYAQQSIIGSGGYFPEDVRDVFSIMSSGRWDIERIITYEFPIDDISRAIETAADADNAFSVVIKF
ncbi:MAG: zinc-binding dehydrogenase [Ruminococcus sp.]|nr:zinc-binding dehydrogenase [Ruminococcus sp.]